MTSSDITYFAETNYRNDKKRFGIKRADRRRHMYVIGKTGTGKTTMLDNMAVQDIQRGNGLAIIDPHGEFAERMLSFVPKERMKDVVYFNPADLEMPLGFNMLEKPSEEMRHFVASGLMSVFKKLWVDAWSARMEYFLSNSILTHLEIEGATLMGVQRIFGDKDYRKVVVSQTKDPVVKAFWENEFAKLPEQFMREAVAAIQNKVGQFISNPLIRNIIGQPDSTFDIRKIMDEKKILIANLSKGKIGEENSKLIGAMLVTKIYLAAMSRVDMPEDMREDFYVYVDEFQNFATEAFASILSEARKYHLNLILAHQYMAQLIDDKTKSSLLRDAIIGNVGTLVSFRVGAEDAEVLEKEFLPAFAIQDFVSLGFANVYLKLMIDGVASPAFSAVTLAPIPAPHENLSRDVIKHSRETYGRRAGEISEEINRWNASLPIPGGGLKVPAPPAFGALSDLVPKEPRRVPQGTDAKRQPRREERREEKSSEPPTAVEPAQEAPRDAAKPRDEQAVSQAVKQEEKKEKKMYKAVCSIDGKEIELPFQPDGRRPVYCQEHLSQIQRGGGGETSQPAVKKPDAPVSTKPAVRLPNAKPVSLSDLLPKDAKPRELSPAKPETRREQSRQSVDLPELRRLIRETVARKETEVTGSGNPAPSAPSDSGVLRPGESVKL